MHGGPPELFGIPSWAGVLAVGIVLGLWPYLIRAAVHLFFDALTWVCAVVFNALEWVFFPKARRGRRGR